ncbi:hypothetical protein [Methylocapsa aurea]|uniref:hypothetical protein n=1 Tax=Methylocapsa aurea TaxID=663610 RepID=UPI00056C0A58|nr:hypothetical protein [Methylocapsa aurea]
MLGNRIFKAASAVFLMLSGATMAAIPAAAAMQYPYGLGVDQNTGALYVADPSSGVFVFNPVSSALSSFVAAPNAFSIAVDNNGLIYAGIVGADGHINVYDANHKAINSLPVPPGDSPITMVLDADNILYQSNGHSATPVPGGQSSTEINAYNNDLTLPYNNANFVAMFPAYRKLQTYTDLAPGTKYALAYDNGRVFVVAKRDGAFIYNVYEAPNLLSGQAVDIFNRTFTAANSLSPDYGAAVVTNHNINVIGSAFATAADANHNIFYTDPDGRNITVAAKGRAAKALLTNLPSSPYGIAFDKSRARLYVSFPSEHLIRAYKVTYATQNGVSVPAISSTPLGIIQQR